MPQKQYYVYLLSNYSRTVIYCGVTDNLVKRVWQHKHEVAKGFSQKYHVHDLIYYEVFDNPENAILREKQIKNYSRLKKEKLIQEFNPEVKDLYSVIASEA